MDPYIAAYRITDGTLNFGVTKRQKTIAGIIVFFVGVGVALVLAGVLIKEAVVERRELFTGANNNNNKAKRRRSIWDAPKDSNNNNNNRTTTTTMQIPHHHHHQQREDQPASPPRRS
eukprot:GEZU01018280.1.p1 GENE.GEZU01018280.1~~GEZU01018280.1.p1  ORF type:complete len:117 (-),score=51.49 GEZU01018280.1:634-984(-)